MDWAWLECTKLVAMATSLVGAKTNFRSFIYSHSSTNTENLAKIGQVDVEIIGLTEIADKHGTQCSCIQNVLHVNHSVFFSTSALNCQ